MAFEIGIQYHFPPLLILWQMTTEIFALGKSCGAEVAHKAFSPSNIQAPSPLPPPPTA